VKQVEACVREATVVQKKPQQVKPRRPLPVLEVTTKVQYQQQKSPCPNELVAGPDKRPVRLKLFAEAGVALAKADEEQQHKVQDSCRLWISDQPRVVDLIDGSEWNLIR
jgi:hypothetical protein